MKHSFQQKAVTVLILLGYFSNLAGTEPRQGSRGQGAQGQVSLRSPSNQLQSPTYRGRELCSEVTTYSQSRRKNCVSKYECNKECTSKKQCKTKYEYKCTDYRRRECKDVWQNKCNGKNRGKRSSESRRQSYKRNERQAEERVGVHRRVKRLIPTEVVYDQSYPIPPSDVPFASETAGQIFDFAAPPQSKRCWQKVRECKWEKYRSSCRNQPVKTCSDKPTQVCENKCKRVYYCDKCSGNTSIKPKPPIIGPPAPPSSGTFIIGAPAPPSKLDVIVDARRKRNNWRRVP